MRVTALFFLYLLLCFSIAAALTEPIMATGWIDQPPHRVMGRLAQLLILIGLWPLLRWLELRSREALGFASPRSMIYRSIRVGWVSGVAMLAALAVAIILLRVRLLDPIDTELYWDLAERLPKALLGGLLIGLLEELFFRGVLFQAIRRHGRATKAIVLSALLYAVLHFMKPDSIPAGAEFGWTQAWQMYLSALTGPFALENLDSLAALFAAGCLLALIRERMGHIGWCIGLHAGWIFVIQMLREASSNNDASSLAFLTGSYDGVIGWLAVGWICLVTLVYWTSDWDNPRDQWS